MMLFKDIPEWNLRYWLRSEAEYKWMRDDIKKWGLR